MSTWQPGYAMREKVTEGPFYTVGDRTVSTQVTSYNFHLMVLKQEQYSFPGNEICALY